MFTVAMSTILLFQILIVLLFQEYNFPVGITQIMPTN